MHPDFAAQVHPVPSARPRLALWSAGYLLLAFPLVIIAYQGLPFPIVNAALPRALLVAVVLLLLTRTLLRREGRSPSEFGLAFSARAGKHIVLGLAGGALLFTTAALLMRVVLPFEWELNPTILPNAIGFALLFHLTTNACEELAWRGYAFDGFMRAFGHWPAQVIVALVAAYFHVLSGWTWQVALISTTAGSLLFGLVFVRWRSIPAAIGVHAAWNWTRDLILTPSGPASVLSPTGMEHWKLAQWNLAQAILVGTTLLACAGLVLSMRRRSESRNLKPPELRG